MASPPAVSLATRADDVEWRHFPSGSVTRQKGTRAQPSGRINTNWLPRCEGERSTIVHAAFDSDNIGAKGFGYLTLNFPASNVPAVSKKRTAEGPKDLIKNGPCRVGSCDLRLVFPPVKSFHEQMRTRRCRGARLQPNLWVDLDMRKPQRHLSQMRVEPYIPASVVPSRGNLLRCIAENGAEPLIYPNIRSKLFFDSADAGL